MMAPPKNNNSNDDDDNENTHLLIPGGRGNTNTRDVPTQKKNKHPKRRNSDGSLDFERIVNGYSIQGE